MDSIKILSIERMDEGDETLVGAKAWGLSRLMRNGLPVPRGFCILSSAYREHMANLGLLQEVESTLEKEASAAPEERQVVLEGLRGRICGTALSDELRREIEHAYQALGAKMVAVRSSATAEDLPGCSFAGQYDTYLGISDLASCIEAVEKCWASLWTERAFDYRERNGYHHLEAEMAVIVQELVPAEAAGVVFTADPVTGKRDRLIIEASFGLGETLVSGRVSPDRLVLAREGLGVLSHTMSEKAVEKMVGEDGTVSEFAVEPDRSKTPCMDETTARSLGEMALLAEFVLGAPQDLEWAQCGGSIYLLQARPITALIQGKSWEDRQVWSNINTGEVMPDVVTPASWSLVEIILDQIFGSIFGRMGLDFGDNPLAGQVAGRAYFNLNTLIGALSWVPGAGKVDIISALGGGKGEAQGLENVVVPDADIPHFDFNLAKALIKLPSFFAWFYSNSLGKGAELIEHFKKEFGYMQKLDYPSLSDRRLLEGIDRIRDILGGTDDIIGIAARSMYYFMTLDRICRQWFDASDGVSANLLCSGLEGMDSAEAGFDLWRLALLVHDHSMIEAVVLSGNDFETCHKRISAEEGGEEFLAMWEKFMADHGHHTRGELEVFNPRWSEDPDCVLDMLLDYLRGMGHMDPLEHKDRNARKREETTLLCRNRLKNPIKGMLFRYFLKQSQLGLVLRENMKSEAVHGLAVIRLILLEMGRRLMERGVLEDEQDVFFISLDEVEPVLHGGGGPGLREKILARRAEYERNKTITPPKVIYGRFDPDNFVPDPVDVDAEVLTGLAVSPGVATGPARVMLRADNGRIKPGEIMVAPFTDPGWTPHFLTAAAIVMDMGGLLSHGSIVAREYGIPTVVNVGPATRIIKTGQTIQVDGTHGIVRIFR